MRADYYQLLDVAPEASPREVKAAYYRQAMRYHPDHNAGNPAAEERFKLVAEAYRTLGVPERRREYDNWLRLHNLYGDESELAAFANTGMRRRVRPFHYSARRARERQERRTGRAAERPRSRRVFRSLPLTGSSRLHTWLFLGFYALVVFNIMPIFLRHMFAEPPRRVKTEAKVEEVPVSEAEARRRVLAMEQALRERAQAGEADAQYQLGLYLFNKSCRGRGEGVQPTVLRRAAGEAWRQEALLWLAQAAGQGHAPARRLLMRLAPQAGPGAPASP